MGFLTAKAKVWYPAITDKMQLHTLFSTMASSIENGLQPRLELQEKAIGLKASVADSTFTFTGSVQTIPYVINANTGDFAQGMSITNGIVTVGTPGMYLVTASIGASTGTNTGMKLMMYKNNTNIAIAEVPQNGSIWVNSSGTSVVNCVTGDTLYVKGSCSNIGAGTTLNKQTAANYISVAMVQAIPV